jgi:DNA-binding winged helix-turn-helix (wHTH) protein
MPAEQRQRVEFAADFRVGEWLVEPSLDRLSRKGTILHLRPQLIDLLVVLAQQAGRTVSKEVILAKVWESQHVAESGLTRCIAEIRQALGDDARVPTMIQTIPKRGYRLVAPVTAMASGTQCEPTEIVPPFSMKTVSPVTNPEPLAVPAGSELATDTVAAPPQPFRLPRRLGVTMGSILGASLVLALSWGAGGWTRVPVLSGRDTVLLADVTNTTGDSSFDGTLRLALAVQLGQAPFLRILPDDHMRTALTLTGRPASQPVVGPVALEVCRREGAAVLLAGSIARMGSHYAVGIETVACRTGDSIDREMLDVNGKEQVLTELGTAAARLRRKLGESRSSLRQYDVPIVRATTPSLDALQALSAGDVNRTMRSGCTAGPLNWIRSSRWLGLAVEPSLGTWICPTKPSRRSEGRTSFATVSASPSGSTSSGTTTALSPTIRTRPPTPTACGSGSTRARPCRPRTSRPCRSTRLGGTPKRCRMRARPSGSRPTVRWLRGC